jgi:hypothetical protein
LSLPYLGGVGVELELKTLRIHLDVAGADLHHLRRLDLEAANGGCGIDKHARHVAIGTVRPRLSVLGLMVIARFSMRRRFFLGVAGIHQVDVRLPPAVGSAGPDPLRTQRP